MTTTDILPAAADPRAWTPQQSNLMQFAGLATIIQSSGQVMLRDRGVAEAFLQIVARTGLDPFARQIYAAELGGKWTIIVGVDGMRVIAQRSGEYEGQTPKEWQRADGVWVDAWTPTTWGGDPGERPIAARVGIWRRGFRQPLVQTVTMAEFGQAGSPKNNWGIRPAHMLGIRAETHALRTAFPNDLSGLYTPEDLDQEHLTDEATAEAAALVERVRGITDKADLERLYHELGQTGRLTDDIRAEIMTCAGVIAAHEEAAARVAPRDDEGNVGDAEPEPPTEEEAPAVKQTREDLERVQAARA